ncbi:MAG: sigma-70 family RNA polymerase sigma factor [Armatimonadetes bacterium]|nr:sigma-70 family RNA polymerase sigma factor [Armatimonadota bacterium]
MKRESVVDGADSRAALERDALARCRAGDRDAYRVLVSLHERAITSAVSRILLNPQEVEDLVQEAFIQAYCKLSSFRGESGFGTWLYRIAVNLSLRRLQQLRRRGWTPLDAMDSLEVPDLRPDSPQPEREAMREDERRALQQALLQLSDAHRTVVSLHYFEDKSCPEIAEIMGCSVGTVWSRLHYALKKLKGHLSDVG